ncbi:unnamed protein product [Vitrella brassicaformis CCMP3155]|uniref:Uncharacterized protein n=1 Tax=Vitrella brassicaformis (strain CCMP3155) TaxID=1169540 RepID=A0A0G4FWI9_VITBC|nr:unnamed protein product [Vitrella brassicaformis CCMP3155]|eukprot:CEM19503.1 unnamed protein product [Vitrella brassicaformis CCMP3155]
MSVNAQEIAEALGKALASKMAKVQGTNAADITQAVVAALGNGGQTSGFSSKPMTDMLKFSGIAGEWYDFYMKLYGLMTARSMEALLPMTEAERAAAPGLWEADSLTQALSAGSKDEPVRRPTKQHRPSRSSGAC